MAQVASAYPCLVIFNSKGALLGWKTAAKTWGEGGADIPLSVIDDTIINKEVDYTYMLCCSGARKTLFMSSTAARKFFAIPSREPLYGSATPRSSPTCNSMSWVSWAARPSRVTAMSYSGAPADTPVSTRWAARRSI